MRKLRLLVIVIIFTVGISGCSLQPEAPITLPPNLNKEEPKLLLEECCGTGEKFCKDNTDYKYEACPINYEEECKDKGGYVDKEFSLATGLTNFSCYESAPDIGVACKSNNECFYSCDLYNGIKNNLCKLEDTEEGEDYTTDTYNCSTEKPGVCSPAPINYNINCGGPKFELKGKKLKIIRNHNDC